MVLFKIDLMNKGKSATNTEYRFIKTRWKN